MNDNLPALSGKIALPELRSDFDGWEPKAVSGWLETAASALGAVGADLVQIRLAFGLALHVLRGELAEGEFGQEERRLAGLAGVDQGTVRRWRAKAEEHYGLETPEKAQARVDAAKARAESARLRAIARSEEEPIDTTATEVDREPNADSGEEPNQPDPVAEERGESNQASSAVNQAGSAEPDPPPSTGPKKRGKLKVSSTPGGLSVGRGEDVALTLTDEEARELLAAIRKHFAAQNAATDPFACKHEKKVQHSWGTICADCKARLR